MSDLPRIVPKPPPEPVAVQVHAYTVEVLERLLERARAGEITSAVVLSWQAADAPRIDMSTEDRILALGAIRTMEHCLVRDWLDGAVQR